MTGGSMASMPSTLSVSFRPSTSEAIRSIACGTSCRFQVLMYPISGVAWANCIIWVKMPVSMGTNFDSR